MHILRRLCKNVCQKNVSEKRENVWDTDNRYTLKWDAGGIGNTMIGAICVGISDTPKFPPMPHCQVIIC